MKPNRTPSLLLALVLLLGLLAGPVAAQGDSDPDSSDPVEPEIPHLLLFSGTYGFRHGSIEHSIETITSLAEQSGAFTVTATEDPADFTPEAFEATDIILFANTTGETPFSDEQKAMFEQWVLDGGGFMGIHAAADTNYEWPFYQELVGAAFDSHPHTGGSGIALLDEATVQVENPEHPIHDDTDVDSFPLREEYYRWRENPRGTQDVEVLLSLDETTTWGFGSPPSLGPVMSSYDDDQPVEWVKTYRGTGRVWYTNLGHYDATYDREEWQHRFLNAVQWVFAGEHTAPTPDPDPEPEPEPQPEPPADDVDGTFISLPAGASTGFATPLVVLPQGSTGTLYNLDNVEHNVESRAKDPVTRKSLFRSEFVNGPGGSTPVLGIAALPPGDYEFICNIHTAMTGTLTITE